MSNSPVGKPNADSKKRYEHKESLDASATYQAHLSFVTHRVNITVNEDVLMGTLSPYCKAVGMLVKKHVLDEKRKSQSGCGFLFFVSLEDAVQAATAIKGACINEITFDCTLSHRSKLVATRQKSFSASPPPVLSVPSLDSTLSTSGRGSSSKLDLFNSSTESLSSSPTASFDDPGLSVPYPCPLPSTFPPLNSPAGYPQLVEYPQMVGQIATYAFSPDGSVVPIVYGSSVRPHFAASMPASITYAYSPPMTARPYPPRAGEAYYMASIPSSSSVPHSYPLAPFPPASPYPRYY